MEDDDSINSSNQFNDNEDQHPIVQQFPRIRKRKQSKSQCQCQCQSQSHLFWYDIRNFPDSLLIEILARLPLKSIFRFKSVCKHWQTLISHPSFRRFYFSILNSNASSLPFRIVHRYIYESSFKELLNLFRPEIYNSPQFPLLLSSCEEDPRKGGQFRVLAMSNGLILCYFSPWVYYICDPITQQWITLPTSKSKYQSFYWEGFITSVNQDHMLTGYTVVRLAFPKDPSNYFIIEMFSSESSEWVSYKLPSIIPNPPLRRCGRGPIHIYGAFHWLVIGNGIGSMIAFDPYKDPKSVRRIPFPKDRDLESEWGQDGSFQICDKCQGTLRYFEVSYDPNKLNFLTMWSMKDYEKGEWCCEYKVKRSDIYSSDPVWGNRLLKATFFPLLFHPLNVNVVYLRCVSLGWIVSYDVLNRRLDVVYKRISMFEDLSWHMAIPFVLPRWPMLMSNHPSRVSGSQEIMV